MATNNKDFKVKYGLVVEGANATVNGNQVLTENASDQYILNLIGGETLVKSVSNEFDVSAGGQLSLDRAVVDAYYDEAGAAGIVAGDLADHENATVAHGATGAVVGTTNTQTLSNKTISYTDNTITVQVANVSDLTASAAELNTLDGITASTAELNLLDGVTATTAELNILDGVTATAAELNILDGATLSTAELNLLDGVTATTAELNYVDGVTSGIQGQLDDKAPLASPALSGVPTAPTATAGTNNTQIATTAYADAAVAALVNGAPDLLNTLNELAEAIGDDANFATTVAGLVADKQDTLTAGSNIDITGATISVTGLDSADISDFNTAALSATALAYDAAGAAALAEQNAIAHADALTTSDIAEGTNLYFTNQRAIDAVGGTIEGAIDLLDTDDIEEGSTNLYFTDSRAKGSAGDLLAGATTDNVEITYVNGVLSITAENGVADSDTDDLTEGTSNLYFTEQRAIDAIQDTTPNFTAVEINSVAKQVASTVSVATASQVTAYEFLGTEYRSAKFLVKTAQGSHTDVAEVLLTMDSSNNISITEYAMVGTNGSLMTITADYVEVGTTVRLRVTTANNSSVVTVVGTLLA
jgi:hypothetical protein